MTDENDLEINLRRVLGPVDAGADLKARLACIPELEIRQLRKPALIAIDWRWITGLGLASALGAFALGVWLGGSVNQPETDALALLTGSNLEYMEELL